PGHIPYGAEYYDTSAFLAGTVSVGVWLLESVGGAYDWTPAEEAQTLAGVQQGLDNWSTLDTGNAQITWFLDTHTGVPVSDDPISYPQGNEQTWINEVMDAQGWTGANAFEKVFAYNNDLRDTFETNWCYSIFMVDSDPAVNQGLFSTGGYAWSYYGGPWIWMSRYSTWAYNAANYFEAVPMHETGHTFWATDEYDNGAQQTQGYRNLPDSPNPSVICLMNQNVHTNICAPTKRQVAWRDDDSNGTMEPLDTPPDAVLDTFAPDPTPDTMPLFTGTATVTTLPNLNSNDRYSPPHDQTICTIDAVECRVDGGAWTSATPVDGTFDAYVEAFSWQAPTLAPGQHVIEARAQSSRGFWTEAFGADTLTVEGGTDAPVVAAAPELRLLPVRPNPVRGGDAAVHFVLPRETEARVTVHTVGGARVRTLFDGVAGAGTRTARWDGRDDAGRAVPAGVYLVRLQSPDGVRSTKVIRSR
ncbi:T9SS type A sorting domain-containing protein, partial [bacterium]|nr:T9SS type A sorting domain-containing protein [bacterium]